MHHTVQHFHGLTLHDAPIMLPIMAVVLVLVIVAVVLFVRESARVGAAAEAHQ